VTRNGCAQPSNGTWLYHLGTIVGVFQRSPRRTAPELLWRGFWDSLDQIEDYPTSVQSIRI
jgi:hypothetical protein